MNSRIFIGLLYLFGCLACAPYPYDYLFGDDETFYTYRYTLYTLNQGDGTMSVIPLKVNENFSKLKDFSVETTSSVPVGNNPIAIAFKYGTNDTDLYPDIVLILNRGGKDIACYDPSQIKVTGRTSLPSNTDPIGMIINKGIIYVADREQKQLFISNSFNNCSNISFDSVALPITPAAIVSGENTIYVIGEGGQSVLLVWGKNVSTLPLAWGVTVTDIFHSGHQYRENYLFGYGGCIPIGTYILTALPNNIYSLMGDSIFSTDAGDAFTLETDDKVPERIYISPDGNNLFVTFQGSGDLWGYGLASGLDLYYVVGSLAFLPSSNIVFIGQPYGNSVYAHTLKGDASDSTIFTGYFPGEIAIVFSPAIAPNRKAY